MDYSLLFAKFWGWYLIIFFFVLSLNPKRIKEVFDDLHDRKFLMLSAFLAIIIGLITLIFHNIWEPNYKLVITLIGWSSLFIGLALFVFPKPTVSWLKITNIKFVQVCYTLLFLVGLFLLNTVYQLIPY
jgi:hypothetical protein